MAGDSAQGQPPNHYRLLGLERFESHPEVVSRAVDRQMAYLRLLQTGTHVEVAQRVLNEISAASGCLLDKEKKEQYDAQLRGAAQSDEAADDDDDKDASMFGEYVLLDKLDKGGGSGQIFKARHRAMGRVVAINILSANIAQRENVERFRRKVKILSRLKHPNLITAFDAGEREGVCYLIMEYVDGDDLVALVRKFNPLPVGHVVGYVSQAAAGLGYAHANGVYHRNIKPSNIMVDTDAVVKVVGLGLAQIDETAGQALEPKQLTMAGSLIGTPDYMSPEQAMASEHVDHRADVYSLGCTMFALLTGRPVFYSAKNLQEKNQGSPSRGAADDHPISPGRAARVGQCLPLDDGQEARGALSVDERLIAALQPF